MSVSGTGNGIKRMSPIEVADPRAGIRLLGEMTASLSHELKNFLAIINENAGFQTLTVVVRAIPGDAISAGRLILIDQ